MRKIIVAALLFVLAFASPAFAASKIYGFTTLSGVGTGALGAIDGTALADKDMAIGVVAGVPYRYYLDANSGVAESSPGVITPATNAGSKRWIRAIGDAADSAVDALNTYGRGTDYTSAVINLAITAIGTGTADIMLRPGAWAITSAVVFTSKIQPIMSAGAYFSISGAGSVTGLKEARPEMFGVNTTPGTTDMSAAFTAANAAVTSGEIELSSTYILDAVTISSDIKLTGKGTLKHKAAGTTHMLTVSGSIDIGPGITIDGNKANQTGRYRAIHFTGTKLVAKGVTFQNTIEAAIRSEDGAWVIVEDCLFTGMAEHSGVLGGISGGIFLNQLTVDSWFSITNNRFIGTAPTGGDGYTPYGIAFRGQAVRKTEALSPGTI